MRRADLLINKTLRRTVGSDEPITFGRFQMPGVTPLSTHEDTRISQRQCELGWEGNALVLTNLSSSIWMRVEYRDTVLHHRVPPATRHVISDNALVLVDGREETRTISVAVPPDARLAPPVTDTVHGPQSVTDDQRKALVALFSGYLRRHPHHSPQPLTAQQAARKIGVSQTAVEKRIERVKDDILEATGQTGFALRVHELAEHLFVTGTLTPQHITWIDEQFRWEGPS